MIVLSVQELSLESSVYASRINMFRINRVSHRMRWFYVQSTVCPVVKRNQMDGKTKEIVKQDQKPSQQTTPKSSADIPKTDTKPPITSVLETSISQVEKVPLHQPTYVPTDAKKTLDVAKEQEDALSLAASFDEMPGPPILKYLAHAWKYLPHLSNQFTAAAMVYFVNMLGRNDDSSEGGASMVWNRGVQPFAHMFDKYGPVVRLQGVFGGDIVFVVRPEHIETVYREEGKYPLRSALDSLEKYRNEHRKQSIAGPFVMFGPDWESLRSKLEVPFMKSVNQFGEQLESVADDFNKNIKPLLNRQEETPEDFDKELFKWAFESVALVTLGRRMHLLSEQKLPPGSEGFSLFNAVQTASSALRRCESGFQLWRFVNTPAYKTLAGACETIDNIILKFIKETETRIQVDRLSIKAEDKKIDLKKEEQLFGTSNQPVPLIDLLLMDGGMSAEDVLTVVLDTLILGANATAHALGFLVYRMAKNPRAQRNLFEELKLAMPQLSTPVAPLIKFGAGEGNSLAFLKACLQESLRMNPPIPVLTRVLPKDIVLHNYRVPRGTVVLMATHVTALREENFEDAKKFKPERWLKTDRDAHPFAALPYGHGPRSCVARRLADIQILLVAAKIFRTFSVEYNYGVIQPTSRLIAMPDKPLKFRFVERS